ncbi:MAG: arylsulfatase [Planctomycetes bacterium]|nr:arylsulfatase [Planctomycetota bacterium]
MTQLAVVAGRWVAGRYLAAVVITLTIHLCALGTERADRPNIVLIVADDLGYGELGCYGQKLIQTPRLDELARQGIRFTQFYCGAPVCAPSRCVLMTGKHSGHAAIRDNRQPDGHNKLSEKYDREFPGQEPLPKDEVTIAELLKARGYATGAMGKWGLGIVGTTGDPNRQGFDLFYGFLCQYQAHNHYPKFLWRNATKESLPGNDATRTGDTYAQDKFAEEALRFIREHQDEPFFLYLPLTIPHLSIQVPDSALEHYAGRIPETPYKHSGSYFPHSSPRAGYAAMVSYMDRDIGRIVDLIEELGLSENTLFLFTSDNGPTYERLGGADSDFFESSGPLRGRKGSVYEGGIRVPLVARWSGTIPTGRTSDHVAAFWDVLPTLCEIAKADVPKNLDGISFLPTLLGQANQSKHEYLYWEFPAYGSQQAVRLGDWKAVRHGVNRGDTDSKFELYDLSSDLAEKHNVAGEHPDVLGRIKEIAKSAHTRSHLFPLLAGEKRGK